MTSLKFFPAVAACFLLFSCDQSLPKSGSAASGQYAPVVQGAGPVPVLAPVSAPAASSAAPAVAGAPGTRLNPAHGMPGHRCDLAVGAPLGSSPATAATPSALPATLNKPVVPNIGSQGGNATVQAAPVISGLNKPVPAASSGLNPRHGEPGHRCDIAVGAPLNSAPAGGSAISPLSPALPSASTNPVTVATQPANPKVINPVQGAGPSSLSGLNPKHGEPGHRCDIAVGAPLNSKPNQ